LYLYIDLDTVTVNNDERAHRQQIGELHIASYTNTDVVLPNTGLFKMIVGVLTT
jgi:hypothetical protein